MSVIVKTALMIAVSHHCILMTDTPNCEPLTAVIPTLLLVRT